MRKQRGLAYYIPTWISNSPLDQHRRNDVPPPSKMNAAEHRHRRNGDGCWISYSMRWRGSPPRRSASPSMRRRRRPRGSSHMPQAWRSRPCQGHLRPQGLHRLRRGRRRRRALTGAGPGTGPWRRQPGASVPAPGRRPAPARAAGARSLPPASPSTQRPGRTCRRTAGPAWPTPCAGGLRSSSPASTASPPSGWAAACHGSCGQSRRDGRMPTGSCEHARRQTIGRPRPFWDHWEKQTATSMLV